MATTLIKTHGNNTVRQVLRHTITPTEKHSYVMFLVKNILKRMSQRSPRGFENIYSTSFISKCINLPKFRVLRKNSI